MNSKAYDEDDIARLGEVIAERVFSKLEPALEALDEIKHQVAKIPRMSERLEIVEDTVSTVRVALISTNHDLRVVKKRTEKLEHFADEVTDHGVRLDLLEQARRQ